METKHAEAPEVQVKEGKRLFSGIGFTYLLGMALIIGVQLLTIWLVGRFKPEWESNMAVYMLLTMLPMYVVTMPAMILLIRRIPAQEIEKKGRISPGAMIVAFIMCFAVMYVSNIVGTVITALIGALKGGQVSNPLLPLATEGSLIVNFFLMVIGAPILEELIFRKLLIDRTAKYGQGMAVLLSGLMFALFHGNLSQFVYAFTLGLFFAFVYVRTGQVKYTIILHMLINFMGSVLGVIVMKYSGYMEYMEAVLGGADPAAALQAAMPGLLIFGLYVIGIICLAIAGVVLLIVMRKKFRLADNGTALPKGKRFSTVFLNAGMGLYVVVWVAYIAVYTLM